MLGFTRQQIGTVTVALCAGAAVIVAVSLGRDQLALAIQGLLLVGVLLALIDMRRRQGDQARRLRLVAERQGRAAKSAARSIREMTDRQDDMARGVETSTALERVAAAERHIELAEAIATIERHLATDREAANATRDRVAQLGADLTGLRDSASRRHNETRGNLRRLEYEPVRQVQALLELFRVVEPTAPLPAAGGWALNPSGLRTLTHLVAQRTPQLIVECGSGASSVWLGYAVRAAGAGRVVSLEHDDEFAERTRSQIAEHGLADHVEVREAPLTMLSLNDGNSYQWYDQSALTDLDGIGLLLVDGPPRATGPMARYPALPVLGGALTADAVIVVDDADRPDEQKMVHQWLAELPNLRLRTTNSASVVILERGRYS